MAVTKISDSELYNEDRFHVCQPDVPGKTAGDMKEFMDYIPRRVIIPKINELIDEACNKADANSVYPKDSTYSKTETDKLLGGKANSDSVYSKTEADTLLTQKLSTDSDSIIVDVDEMPNHENADKGVIYRYKNNLYTCNDTNDGIIQLNKETTIPEASDEIQTVTELPAADESIVGKLYRYDGKIYECIHSGISKLSLEPLSCTYTSESELTAKLDTLTFDFDLIGDSFSLCPFIYGEDELEGYVVICKSGGGYYLTIYYDDVDHSSWTLSDWINGRVYVASYVTDATATAFANFLTQNPSDEASELLEKKEYSLSPVVTEKDLEDLSVGKDGKSAYEYACDGGYTGTEEEFAQKLATDIDTVPDYVKTEAETVSEKILSVAGFNMAFITDLHFDETFSGLESASKALGAIEQTAPLDLVVFGGDYITNWSAQTTEVARTDISDCRKMFADCCKAPVVWLVGNHDSNGYPDVKLSKAEVYNRIFRGSDKNVIGNPADPCGSYGYMDFENAKMRVIFANSSDNSEMGDKEPADPSYASDLINAWTFSATQLQWIADVALDFSDKENADAWRFIICSHVPVYRDPEEAQDAGWHNSHTYTDENSVSWQCNVINLSNLIKAYSNKTTFTATLNNKTCTNDFAGASNAGFVCFVNGHGHNHRVSEYNGFKHIWVPNACDGSRESEDGHYYNKAPNTVNDTAFNVLTFDTANETVYAWKYGAGYDRVIDVSSESEGPAYTNLADPTADGWVHNSRLSTSNGAAKTAGTLAGAEVTNYILIPNQSMTLRVKGLDIITVHSDSSPTVIWRYSDKNESTQIAGSGIYPAQLATSVTYDEATGITAWSMGERVLPGEYIRLSGTLSDGYTAEDIIITLDEEII